MKLVPIYEVEDFEKRISSTVPTYINPEHILKISTEQSIHQKISSNTYMNYTHTTITTTTHHTLNTLEDIDKIVHMLTN